MRQTNPLRRWWILALATIAATLGAFCVAATFAGANAGPPLVLGKGTWIAGHTDFVGFYRAYVAGRWVKVYCVSPARRAPTAIRLHVTARVAGTSRTVTRQLAETLAAHGNAQTAAQAEAVSQALNREIGNRAAVRRRATYLPRRVDALAARYVDEARRQHGPYRLALRLGSSPLPGQSGTGTVTLRSALGAPVAHDVMLAHTSNVATPRLVRTDRTGRASFRYATTFGGAVHITASARLLPTTVRASGPAPGTQRMLTWAPPAPVHANATYQGSGPGISHRYACTSTCDGHPRVTVSACAPADHYPSRISFWVGDTTHRLFFPAARGRVCKSWNTVLADGVTVSATWEYRTPSGWTRRLPASGWFTVDCPAAPPVAVNLGYDCQHATLSAVLGNVRGGALVPLHNTSTHRMVLVLAGAATGRYVLAPKATATVHTVPLACGTRAVVTVRSGVQRGSGGYNYGAAVEVRGP